MSSNDTPGAPAGTDEWLGGCLRRIAAGGSPAARAMADLYAAYRLRVLGYLLREGVPPAAAEDVLHTVFVKVAERAGQWRGDGAAGAWFWRLVRNARIDLFRERGLEVAVDDEGWQAICEHVAGDLGDASSADLQRCVQHALQRFAKDYPQRAEALRLLHLEHWSIAQVADFIARTAGATKEFLSQCRVVFRPYLRPCLEFLRP